VFTVSFAVKAEGQKDGAGVPDGPIHGQLCWGAKEIVMEQPCCGRRENNVPSEGAQLSCSVKLARPLKSLNPFGRNSNDRLLRVEPDGSVLVRTTVCDVGAEPSNCEGKLMNLRDNVIGCWQALWSESVSARQMLPESPGLTKPSPGHDFVFTA